MAPKVRVSSAGGLNDRKWVRLMFTKAILGVAGAAAVVGLAGGPVLAGQGDGPQGRTEQGNGMSICIFSGLNDEPDDPIEGGQVQSYGQVVKVVGVAALKAAGDTPADLCNPHVSPIDPYWRSVPQGPKAP